MDLLAPGISSQLAPPSPRWRGRAPNATLLVGCQPCAHCQGQGNSDSVSVLTTALPVPKFTANGHTALEIGQGAGTHPLTLEESAPGLTLRAISLLPRGWGLACPAVGGAGHDPAPPLAGPWLSGRLALAVPGLGPFNLHLEKPSSGSGGCGGPGPLPLRHTLR